MKRPSFQFYPADWQANSNLRRCSHEEKGIWLDVLCLLHDQEEYGVVRWSLKEIALAVACPLMKLKGLINKQILKGSDEKLIEPYIYVPRSGRKDGEPVELIAAQPGPLWYSSRMVKDEYVRTIRGESSRFCAGNDAAPRHAPKPPIGDGSSSSTSSTPSVVRSGPGRSAPRNDPAASKTLSTLASYLAQRSAAGLEPFDEGCPADRYATDIKLPLDFLALAWREFKTQHTDGDRRSKRQASWPLTFANCLRGNWYGLWWLNGDTYELTTKGKQALLSQQSRRQAA